MHHTFEITIGNNSNSTVLEFDIYKTDIAQRWAEEIAKEYSLYETDRFTNWPNSTKNKSYYEYWLQHHINVITTYGHPILLDNLNYQDALNELHKHFEDLRGHVDFPSKWYSNAPETIKTSVDRLNVLIHEYENLIDEENYAYCNPTIVCTFKNRPKYNLKETDYQHFTHQWKYGTVYINYCEVGKPLLDVFKDQDTHVEAIRPQSTYSADFMIKFGPSVPEEYAKNKQKVFDKWYADQGLSFKYLSLGMIPVAQIKQEIDINSMFMYDRIINVSCRK